MSVMIVMTILAVLCANAEFLINCWNTFTSLFIALLYIMVIIDLKIIMAMIVVMTVCP